ncbi:Zn-ribbon domain-containing OB-fold protein [Nocardia beijingensis]|uniref:Zn-ribbon domain-containing OB-fold protein n=1 Tax=Nocardia beijingensis TaxID=95162 RepID=UPI000A07CC3B|nr:OB-fold domain-containing protein [Nocardia beijingensis]
MHPSDLKKPAHSLGDGRQPCADDVLMIHRCVRCAKLLAPITSGCSSCGSGELERVPSSGAGSVVSWRVVDRAPFDRQGGLVPLMIAIVALDEGPWVYTCLEGQMPSSPNGEVRVRFQPHPWEDRFPVFAVSADPRSRHIGP